VTCALCFGLSRTAPKIRNEDSRISELRLYLSCLTSLLTKLGVAGAGAAARDPEDVPGFEGALPAIFGSVLLLLLLLLVESSFFVLLKYFPTDDENP
jgi:hypothetical protein